MPFPPKINYMEKKFIRPRPRRPRGPSGPRPDGDPDSELMDPSSNAPSGHLSAEVVQDIAEAAMAANEEEAAAAAAINAGAATAENGDVGPTPAIRALPGESLSGDAARPPRDARPPRQDQRDPRPPRDPQTQQQAAQQRREAEQARRDAEQARREQERQRREEDQRRRQAEQQRRESQDRALLPIDDLCQKAWQIFLAEVGEEGVELFPDNEARELTRRSFRLAEIFMQEELRVRRPAPLAAPPQREREPRETRPRDNGQNAPGSPVETSPEPTENPEPATPDTPAETTEVTPENTES